MGPRVSGQNRLWQLISELGLANKLGFVKLPSSWTLMVPSSRLVRDSMVRAWLMAPSNNNGLREHIARLEWGSGTARSRSGGINDPMTWHLARYNEHASKLTKRIIGFDGGTTIQVDRGFACLNICHHVSLSHMLYLIVTSPCMFFACHIRLLYHLACYSQYHIQLSHAIFTYHFWILHIIRLCAMHIILENIHSCTMESLKYLR